VVLFLFVTTLYTKPVTLSSVFRNFLEKFFIFFRGGDLRESHPGTPTPGNSAAKSPPPGMGGQFEPGDLRQVDGLAGQPFLAGHIDRANLLDSRPNVQTQSLELYPPGKQAVYRVHLLGRWNE